MKAGNIGTKLQESEEDFMKKSYKKILLAVMVIVLTFGMTACGNGGSGSAENTSSDGDSALKSLTVGISASPKPFNYQDENGELTGLEVDMLKHIAEKNNIDLNFEITEFESMFVGLDAGRYDLIVGNISKKPEREEKYLLSSEPYFRSKIALITAEGNTEIKTVEDLGGKKVPAGAGRANALFMESYNEQHPDNPIDIQYTDADASAALIDLNNGRYDACIYNTTYVSGVTQEYGYNFNVYDIPNADDIEKPEAWFLFSKTNTDLRDFFDEQIAAMKEDGSLSELSVKYFGEDYIPKN